MVVRDRLLDEDIESRARDPPVSQRADERVLVDAPTPGGVDELRLRSHQL